MNGLWAKRHARTKARRLSHVDSQGEDWSLATSKGLSTSQQLSNWAEIKGRLGRALGCNHDGVREDEANSLDLSRFWAMFGVVGEAQMNRFIPGRRSETIKKNDSRRRLLAELGWWDLWRTVTPMRLTWLTVLATLFVSKLAFAAGAPVALVEDVTGAPGVEFMDYVEAGKIIPLNDQDSIVLSYLYSCVRETITGGTITVGKEQSDVRSGKVVRTLIPCDAGRMLLSAQLASESAGTISRNWEAKQAEPALSSAPLFVLYGLSPIIDLRGGGGTVEIRRVDRGSERYVLPIADQQLIRHEFYDLADFGLTLAAGAVYRATLGSQGITFSVDPSAKPGKTPIVGRLLRFDKAPWGWWLVGRNAFGTTTTSLILAGDVRGTYPGRKRHRVFYINPQQADRRRPAALLTDWADRAPAISW
jgi:hypothetical protein